MDLSKLPIEPETGVEPATFPLRRDCSSKLSYSGIVARSLGFEPSRQSDLESNPRTQARPPSVICFGPPSRAKNEEGQETLVCRPSSRIL